MMFFPLKNRIVKTLKLYFRQKQKQNLQGKKGFTTFLTDKTNMIVKTSLFIDRTPNKFYFRHFSGQLFKLRIKFYNFFTFKTNRIFMTSSILIKLLTIFIFSSQITNKLITFYNFFPP